jgi:hypothetical protein
MTFNSNLTSIVCKTVLFVQRGIVLFIRSGSGKIGGTQPTTPHARLGNTTTRPTEYKNGVRAVFSHVIRTRVGLHFRWSIRARTAKPNHRRASTRYTSHRAAIRSTENARDRRSKIRNPPRTSQNCVAVVVHR